MQQTERTGVELQRLQSRESRGLGHRERPTRGGSLAGRSCASRSSRSLLQVLQQERVALCGHRHARNVVQNRAHSAWIQNSEIRSTWKWPTQWVLKWKWMHSMDEFTVKENVLLDDGVQFVACFIEKLVSVSADTRARCRSPSANGSSPAASPSPLTHSKISFLNTIPGFYSFNLPESSNTISS